MFLGCREVLELLDDFVDDSDFEYLPISGFREFLTLKQREQNSEVERLLRIVQEEFHEIFFEAPTGLSQQGLYHYLRSQWNTAQDPLRNAHALSYSMDRPLSNYWIKSCSDPFCGSNSLQGGLIDTLTRGYRMFPIFFDGSQKDKTKLFVRQAVLDGTAMELETFLSIVNQYAFCVSELYTAKISGQTTLEPLFILAIPRCSPEQVEFLSSKLLQSLGEQLYIAGTCKRADTPSVKHGFSR